MFVSKAYLISQSSIQKKTSLVVAKVSCSRKGSELGGSCGCRSYLADDGSW